MPLKQHAGLLVVLSVMLMDACTLRPNYRIPDRALMNARSARGAFVASTDPSVTPAALPPNWWRLYDGRKLDGLVQQALIANTDPRMANANLEHSEALLREARTLRQPSVAVGASVEYAQLAGEQYLLPIIPRSPYYDGQITVEYDLDLFGGIRRGIEAARANDEAVEAARDLVRAAETARAYVGACGAGLQLGAAGHSLALQRKSLDLTNQLLRGGRAVDLDATRSRDLADELEDW